MRLFSENELGRISYLLILILMLGFDFAKPHIEKYAARVGGAVSISAFEGSHDTATITGPPKKLPSFGKLGSNPSFEAAAQDDRNGPIFQFAGKMMAEHEKARAEGVEINERLNRHLVFNALMGLPGNENAVGKMATVAIGQTLMPLVVLLLTTVTVPILLWMVTGRVRNIGWHQSAAYAILAVFFLPKVLGSLMPLALAPFTSPLFFLLLVVIAFIPSAGGGWFGGDPKPVYDLYVPPARRAKPGEFGRRGVE